MKLFQKGHIGRLRLKNRIIMSPMNVGGNNDSDGCLSPRGINYFVERAKGGVEAAINVAKQGGHPVIIEKLAQIAGTAYSVNRQHLEVMIQDLQIPVYKEVEILECMGHSLKCLHHGNDIVFEFDKIAQCVGMKPNFTGLEDLPNIIIVGDADGPENVMKAVWSAYRQCRLI